MIVNIRNLKLNIRFLNILNPKSEIRNPKAHEQGSGGPAKFLALPPTVCIRHTPGGGRALTSSRACAMKCQENKKYAVGRIYNPWENFEACTVALEQHDIKC